MGSNSVTDPQSNGEWLVGKLDLEIGMDGFELISRRSFLTTGVVAGVGVALPGRGWAASSVSAHCVAIENWIAKGRIGSVVNIQFHCAEGFELQTAVKTSEHICQSRNLEKVSALGDWVFSRAPENVLASLYFSGGLRASVSSAVSTLPSYGNVLGDKGSIVLRGGGIDLLGVDGSVVDSVLVIPQRYEKSSVAYPMILKGLRQGVTVYAEK